MKEEIAAGIRNAMSRGSSLESAKQSFLNAGYSPREVEEAANSFSDGASTHVDSGSGEIPTNKELPQLPMKKKKSSAGKVVLIVLVVVASLILLSAVGYLVYVLARG